MKLRTKIAITIIPIMLILVIGTNLAFGVFFQSFVLALEDSQINMAKENISSYIQEKKAKYIAHANDWGHWDDTYMFVWGENDAFIRDNIAESTFTNLDVSFMIYTDVNGKPYFQKYFSFDAVTFAEFPEGFFDGYADVFHYAQQMDDTFGIFEMGDGFYFVAMTDITDSIMIEQPIGKILLGRKIDGSILGSMGKISGSTLSPIRMTNNPNTEGEGGAVLTHTSRNDKQDTIAIELTIPNAFNPQSSVLFALTMPRTLLIMGMGRVAGFIVSNTVWSVLIALAVFILLGLYLTRPFMKLTGDMHNIDLTKKEFQKLPDAG